MSLGPTSAALVPFIRGKAAPYVINGVAVTAALVKGEDPRFVGAQQSRAHRVADFAIAWETTGPVLGARWLCGNGSKGARQILLHPEWYPKCERCEAIAGGDLGPCVYRVYDKSGDRLLYIGSTNDWLRRRGQHRKSTWWWAGAGRVDCERFATIGEARDAESKAIRAEKPRMNIAHNRGEVVA